MSENLTIPANVERRTLLDGTRIITLNGQYHSVDDEPAVERFTKPVKPTPVGYQEKDPDALPLGQREWFQNGRLHRDGDKPAVEHFNGDVEYFQHGQRHRENGPAVIQKKGGEEYWQDGRRHRDEGPAILRKNGDREWYQNGLHHRDDDQPALIRAGGSIQQWFQHGRLHRGGDKPAVIVEGYRETWYQRGLIHRDGDQPAHIDTASHATSPDYVVPGFYASDGQPARGVQFYKDGIPHREGKPASIDSRGQSWKENGLTIKGVLDGHQY